MNRWDVFLQQIFWSTVDNKPKWQWWVKCSRSRSVSLDLRTCFVALPLRTHSFDDDFSSSFLFTKYLFTISSSNYSQRIFLTRSLIILIFVYTWESLDCKCIQVENPSMCDTEMQRLNEPTWFNMLEIWTGECGLREKSTESTEIGSWAHFCMEIFFEALKFKEWVVSNPWFEEVTQK